VKAPEFPGTLFEGKMEQTKESRIAELEAWVGFLRNRLIEEVAQKLFVRSRVSSTMSGLATDSWLETVEKSKFMEMARNELFVTLDIFRRTVSRGNDDADGTVSVRGEGEGVQAQYVPGRRL
jgi:hypothetical protein